MSPRGWLNRRVTKGLPIIRLGSAYGGWVLVDDPALRGLGALLVGAGEDLTFDLALQAKYACEVLIVDPTPRAVVHYDNLVESQRSGKPFASPDGGPYDFDGVDFSRISYAPVALWTHRQDLTFWAPADPSHVSYSATNIQKTSHSITVPADTIDTLAATLTAPLGLVKIDIEGAAIPVLRDMLVKGVHPRQVLVEYEELVFPTKDAVEAVKSSVEAMLSAGYRLAHFDGHANCTFVSKGAVPASAAARES